MTNIDIYLTRDFKARRNSSLISCAVGVIIAPISLGLGASIGTTSGLCVAAAGIVEIARALKYRISSKNVLWIPFLPAHRRLLYTSVAAIVILVIAVSVAPISTT